MVLVERLDYINYIIGIIPLYTIEVASKDKDDVKKMASNYFVF